MSDIEHNELTPSEVRAIAELLTARTIDEAARRSGVAERTLRRWLDRADFRAALRAEQRGLMQQVTSRLQVASSRAVDALTVVLDDLTAPASARVSAARTVLELAREGVEVEAIAARLDALEQAHVAPNNTKRE